MKEPQPTNTVSLLFRTVLPLTLLHYPHQTLPGLTTLSRRRQLNLIQQRLTRPLTNRRINTTLDIFLINPPLNLATPASNVKTPEFTLLEISCEFPEPT